MISGNPRKAEKYIKNNEFLSAEAKLKIHFDNYRTKLSLALEKDFSCFKHLMGKKGGELMQSYIEANLPNFDMRERHYLRFPRFLETLGFDGMEWEMALLESARAELSLAVEKPTFSGTDFKKMSLEEFGNLKLPLTNCCKLLAFNYDCESYRQKFAVNLIAKAKLKKSTNYLLLYRQGSKVLGAKLSREEYEILFALDNGQKVGQAIAFVMASKSLNHKEITSKIQKWFPAWVKMNIFSSELN
jgi:hypothetical protein